MNSEDANLLTIRDAAQRLGVTSRTLKYYEELGLITPSRSESRYRLYNEEVLERFGRILRLRSLGFSLHAIAEMLKRPLEALGDGSKGYSMTSITEITDAVVKQIEALDARIATVSRELKEARAIRAELGDDLDYLQRRAAGESAEILLPKRIAARKRRRSRSEAQDDAE